jgi:hypothetical protein
MLWRGFDGGQDVRAYMDDFFGAVGNRSKVVTRMTGELEAKADRA